MPVKMESSMISCEDLLWEAKAIDWEGEVVCRCGVKANERLGERLLPPLSHCGARIPLARCAGWKVRGHSCFGPKLIIICHFEVN